MDIKFYRYNENKITSSVEKLITIVNISMLIRHFIFEFNSFYKASSHCFYLSYED